MPPTEAPVRKNFFTEEEKIWLNGWMQEFVGLDGKKKADSEISIAGDITGISRARRFDERIVNAFAARFPYRHPESHRSMQLTDIEQELRMKTEDWGQLGMVRGARSIIHFKLILFS
jgi:hypothetical protein